MPRHFRADHNDRPDVKENAFGKRGTVFFPADHAVLAIRTADDADTLCDRLYDAGMAPLLESPERMAAFLGPTFGDAAQASAPIAPEAKQSEILYQLALAGCWFMIVPVRGPDDAERIVRQAQGLPVAKALCYRTLTIEELPVGIEVVPGDSPYGRNEVPRNKPSDAQGTGPGPRPLR